MNQIQKIGLGLYPTPLQEISTKNFGGNDNIRLFIKRDDLCGICFGGNKIRKLEYILADALASGADCIVTGGGSQSNQTSAIAACCAKLNLPAYIVVPESTGNITRSVVILSGAVLHYAENGQTNILMKEIRSIASDLRIEGHKPYIVPPGASTPLGAIGYVDAMREMYGQAKELNIPFDHVLCCGATGNTYAGVALGTKLYSPATQSMAIAIGRRFTHKETLMKQIHQAEQIL